MKIDGWNRLVNGLEKCPLLVLFLAGIFLNIACSDDASSNYGIKDGSEIYEEFTFPGMVKINATGINIKLGSDDKKSWVKERPSMVVGLDYDYYLGKHEVTCGEYTALLQCTECFCNLENAEYPVTNVNFYDAILYANAKSKAENLDTAYTYVEAEFLPTGGCESLEGLVFHPEVNAYRLPTEAEWMMAAYQGWKKNGEWFAENSQMKALPVCSLGANNLGICDLAGNVKEFVNDRLGLFKDSTVIDYIGAPNLGEGDERVLKGGSFLSDSSSVYVYGRGDVYAVNSKSKSNYTGFRLALGIIPNATILNNKGHVQKNDVEVLAGSSLIQANVGHDKTKLVFRNEITGNISMVDFFGGKINVAEFDDSVDAYHPAISPDGNNVAFCTKSEGDIGKSELYVRHLKRNDTTLVKLDVESAAIPRWMVFNNDTFIVYVNDTQVNSDEMVWKQQSTWLVQYKNDSFGVPAKILDGTFHGGISTDGTLAVTGARLLRSRVAANGGSIYDAYANDFLWYNGEQACNASLARDGSKRTLFLDFGGATGAAFVGAPYREHERILVVDSVGNLLQTVASPAGYAFDHTEWVYGQNKAVATLRDVNGNHKKIVLVDFASETITDLVQGDDLWHPDLWTVDAILANQCAGIDLDSAANYISKSPFENANVEIALKLKRFWEKRDSVEAFVLGSSRVLSGVIDDSVKSYKTLNMGISLSDLYMSDLLIRQYILLFAKKTKFLIVELPIDFMFRHQDEYTSYVVSENPGFIYDNAHLRTEEDAVKISRLAEDLDVSVNDLSGYIPNTMLMEQNSWDLEFKVYVDTMQYSIDDLNLSMNMMILYNLNLLCIQNNVKLIGVIMPQSPDYAKTGSFGFYGPKRSVAMEVIQKIGEMGITIFDENKMGAHDYSDEMASNSFHLCDKGALRFTKRLDSLLTTLSK